MNKEFDMVDFANETMKKANVLINKNVSENSDYINLRNSCLDLSIAALENTIKFLIKIDGQKEVIEKLEQDLQKIKTLMEQN